MLQKLAIALSVMAIGAITGTYSIYLYIYNNAQANAGLTSSSLFANNLNYTPHLLYYNDDGILNYYLYFTFNSGNLTVFLKDVETLNNDTNSTLLNALINNNITPLISINQKVKGFYWNISEIKCKAVTTALVITYNENITNKVLRYSQIISKLYGNMTNNNVTQKILDYYENYNSTLLRLGYSKPQSIKINEMIEVNYSGNTIDILAKNNANIPVFFKNITVYVSYSGVNNENQEYAIKINSYFLPGNTSSYSLNLNSPQNGSYSSAKIYAVLYYSDILGQGEAQSNVITLIAKAYLSLYYSHGTVHISVENQGNIQMYFSSVQISAVLTYINGSSVQKVYTANINNYFSPTSTYSLTINLPYGNYSSISIDGVLYYSSSLGQGRAEYQCVLEAKPKISLDYVNNVLTITVEDQGNINLFLDHIVIIYTTSTNITNEIIINVNSSILSYAQYYTQIDLVNVTKITVVLYYSDIIGQGEETDVVNVTTS